MDKSQGLLASNRAACSRRSDDPSASRRRCPGVKQQTHIENVHVGVVIPVHVQTATLTAKGSLSQRNGLLMTASATDRGGALEAVNGGDMLAPLECDVLEDFQERAKAQVADLATPQLLHPIQVQVLKDQHVVCVAECMSQFEVKVSPLIGNANMSARK